MQPLQLNLKNFGPYKEASIDFRQFEDKGLFLISGKTGSGKTTIFDAMCYALYGVTSGGLRQGKEMRSNFAEPSTPTEVSFRFQHKQSVYQLVRMPEQILQKKRGEGTREQPAKVVLTVYDLQGAEKEEFKKQKEIQAYIESLLHLNAAQFCQIVLLPQGEFRRFLNANSNEKETVLRKLFATDIYREFAFQIKERKKIQQASLAEEETSIQLLLKQANWHEQYQKQVSETKNVEAIVAYLLEQQNFYHDQIKLQNKQVETKRKEYDVLLDQLQKEQVLLGYYAEQEKLLEKQRVQRMQQTVMQKLQDEVAQIRWSIEHQETFLRLTEVRKELLDAQKECSTSQQRLKEAQEEKRLFQEKVTHISQQEKKYQAKREQVVQMEQLLPLIGKIDEQSQMKTYYEEQLKVQTVSYENCQKKIDRQTRQLQQLAQLIQKEPQLLKQQNQLERSIERIQGLIEQSQNGAKLFEVGNELKQSVEEKQFESNQLEQLVTLKEAEYAQLKSDWASAQIARLSLDLLEGEPCPVCGSTEHPQPHFQSAAVSKEVLANLEQDYARVEEERMQLLEKWMQSKQQLASNQEKLGINQKEYTKEKDKVIVRLADFRQSNTQIVVPDSFAESKSAWKEFLDCLNKQKQIVEQEQQDTLATLIEIEKKQVEYTSNAEQNKVAVQELESLKATLAETKQQLGQFASSLVSLKQQLPAKWQGINFVEEIEANKKALRQYETDKKETEVAYQNSANVVLRFQTESKSKDAYKTQIEQQLVRLSERFAKILSEQSATLTEKDFEELYQKKKQLPEWSQQLEMYQTEQQKIQLEAKSLEHKIAGRQKPEIVELEQSVARAKEALNPLEKAVLILEQTVAQNQKIYQNIVEKRTQIKRQWQILAELNQLSEVASGDGTQSKLSLERFVLQSYMEEVLRVANGYFMNLSNQRYSFELNVQDGSYKSQTGLAINVYDDNVGEVRSVNTLSGGESFIAALALSLSLAEVVQQQSGGVTIDTLFIDEGFGSLDEDSLEMAMAALEQIQSHGRMIGIISHVKELKERIPQQLKVKTKGTGQSVITYQTEFE